VRVVPRAPVPWSVGPPRRSDNRPHRTKIKNARARIGRTTKESSSTPKGP
jgi:hypothetical protein